VEKNKYDDYQCNCLGKRLLEKKKCICDPEIRYLACILNEYHGTLRGHL